MLYRTILYTNLNGRSMNQGKLEVVKQDMSRMNINILEFSELKWTKMGKFNSDDHYIYNRLSFLLWLSPFILSGVISLLFSSSTLGTYPSGEFIFQCYIFLLFHTVNGVLKVRILK